MGLIALVLSICALSACVYLWLESQRKLSAKDIAPALSQASEELTKNYARSLRDIETEWADMYQKFSRLVGRVDKNRGLESVQSAPSPRPALVRTESRSDLLRKHRGGAQRE